jgi:hypothetical protein
MASIALALLLAIALKVARVLCQCMYVPKYDRLQTPQIPLVIPHKSLFLCNMTQDDIIASACRLFAIYM